MVAIATPSLSFAVVELKICEGYGCGRSFLRGAGSSAVCCVDCDPAAFSRLSRKENTPKETGTFGMIREDEMNGTEKSKSPVPASSAAPSPAPRTCTHPDCENILRPGNISGKCQQHRSHTKSNGNSAGAKKTNGHAVAGKTNGVDRHLLLVGGDRPHNGNGGKPQLAAERAKTLLADPDLARLIWAAIPEDDKTAFCAAWLSGQN
jgi:hypothetical protein